MNRKEKIEFLNGLKTGRRSVMELVSTDITNLENLHILVETTTAGVYTGKNGEITEEEIQNLSGHIVKIMNPHAVDLSKLTDEELRTISELQKKVLDEPTAND